MNEQLVLAKARLTVVLLWSRMEKLGKEPKSLLERGHDMTPSSCILCPGAGAAAPSSHFQLFTHHSITNQGSIDPKRKTVGWESELSADGSQQPPFRAS